MRRSLIALAIAAAVLGAAPGASAHHSFAMYDPAKVVVLKGTIKTVQWNNPHVVLWLMGSPDGAGAAELWTVELTSPGNLTRLGWTRQTMKPGSKVAVEINPLRSGEHGGAFRNMTQPDGQVLSAILRDLEKGNGQPH